MCIRPGCWALHTHNGKPGPWGGPSRRRRTPRGVYRSAHESSPPDQGKTSGATRRDMGLGRPEPKAEPPRPIPSGLYIESHACQPHRGSPSRSINTLVHHHDGNSDSTPSKSRVYHIVEDRTERIAQTDGRGVSVAGLQLPPGQKDLLYRIRRIRSDRDQVLNPGHIAGNG